MIYTIKQSDLHKTHAEYFCGCCGELVYVGFEDLGGYALEIDIGLKMFKEDGQWLAESYTARKKRKELTE